MSHSEVIVKLAAEVAFSLLKATDVVVRYLANSVSVEFTLTGCTLTVTTVDGESSENTCSPSMLEAAKVDLEQLTPRSDPDADPGPTRITVTICMANPGGTSQLTTEALTDLRRKYGFDTSKCEVSFQDFDVVPGRLGGENERWAHDGNRRGHCGRWDRRSCGSFGD